MLPQLQGHAAVEPITVKPFGFPLMIFNERAGPMTDVAVRRAAQAALSCSDMLAAAFGDPAFFDAQGSIYAQGTPYYDPPSAGLYDADDPKKAGDLLKQAGYKGQPVRIMTSQQYDFLYKMSLVAQQNLQDAGFAVDLQVLDWATLLSRRGGDKAWDAFFTYHTFVPEPSHITILNPSYPAGGTRRRSAPRSTPSTATPIRPGASPTGRRSRTRSTPRRPPSRSATSITSRPARSA